MHGWHAAADGGDWLPARVPGTAAAVLADAGLAPRDLDAQEWCFRVAFEAAAPAANEELVLQLDGLATVCEVALDGAVLLESESMFERHVVPIGGGGELPSAAGRSRRSLRSRASRAHGGARSSRTTTCAGIARCCSAGRPASRPGRRRSAHGGP